MSGITSHILDTTRGKPAAGVQIELEVKLQDSEWMAAGFGTTDDDGRVSNLLKNEFKPGEYRISFLVKEYFESQNVKSFYPTVRIEFIVEDTSEHYHVPLLLNPFGYSTYRGS
ncbi:MAG: hydroxyisourate hydrolase [Mariniblastus sp.]